MKWNSVYLSMGSNIDNKFFYLLSGIFKISELTQTKIIAISKFYSTAPIGYLDQDNFLNCAIEIKTKLLPYELLKKLQKIELELKRERIVRWGPRTLDIDIIFYDTLELNDPILTLPHPRYKERNFVLIPLLDIVKNKKLISFFIDYNDSSVIVEKKEKLLISGCLLGDKTSYKGEANYNYILGKLLKNCFEYIVVCPEVDGGLATPRPPAEIIKDKVMTIDGFDVTKEFQLGAKKSLEEIKKNNIKIALLKGKSPSCGINIIYDGSFSKKTISGNGITTQKLLLEGVNIIEVNKNE